MGKCILLKRIRIRIFFILIILIVFLWHINLPVSADKIKTKTISNKGIVFNGWYHGGKEKWRGPYHNKALFTWITIRTSAENRNKYHRLINRQLKEGVQYMGYYYSATTTRALEDIGHPSRFPERRIPPEAIKYSWILRNSEGKPVTWHNDKSRYYLDVGLKQVQDAILKRAIKNAKSLNTNMLFLDNWVYKYWAPEGTTEEEWTEKCLSFLIRARELTKINNLKLVVNLSSPVDAWVEFALYLDGISYEMAAHPNRLKSKQLFEKELKSYERIMDMGKSIFLWTDMLKDEGGRWDEDGRKVAATAMLVMPEEQPCWGGIYVANPRYEAWPVGGWAMWPEQLGRPLGARQWDGNRIMRRFENGFVSITVGQDTKFNISIEY